MAQGKQTPRQKMINLMYLVFIAMLALNIDQEIIRSYYDSTQSLKETRLLTEDKNSAIFEKTLAAKAQQVPDTYAQPYTQYQELKGKIDALVSHADQVKTKLQKDAEFNPSATITDNFASLNNNEAGTDYFFNGGDENMPSKNAADLKAKMDEVRNYIITTFGNNPAMAKLVDRAKKSLTPDFPKGKDDLGKTWLQAKFYHQPLIAAMSNLEIIQNDARNVQSDALALMLQEKVDATIKFNNYDAVVSAPDVVIQGKPAQATVYLATYSNSNKISISGVDRQENGKGYKTLGSGGVGKQTFSGSVTLNDASGKPQSFPFTHTYEVIAGPQEVKYETGAVVSADKMNVLYRGLDNPMSAKILGVDNSRLSLSASGASVSGAGPGKWIVRPGGGNIVKVTVSGTGPRGTTSQSFDFRIKNVPPPQGLVRGKSMAPMPASSIANQTVTAAIPDFDFPVSFQVNSFMVKVAGRAAMMVTGNSLQPAEGLFRNLKAGDVVGIYGINVTATGLGGQVVKTPSNVIITVQ